MTKKIGTIALCCAALLPALTLLPRNARADSFSITLSQLPFTFLIPEPASESLAEPDLNLVITNGRWINPFTVLVTDSSTADNPGSLSDIFTFFNDLITGQATVCGESDPIPATPVCPTNVGTIFTGVDGGGGSGDRITSNAPAIVLIQNTDTGGTVGLRVEACGGPSSCAKVGSGLSDGARISVAPVPEPGTLALFGAGMFVVGLRRRFRRKT
jgi:hypothetical protein